MADQRVLVTGSDLNGAAAARAFASAGALVALAGGDELALRRTAQAVEAAGGRALVLRGDVAEPGGLASIVRGAIGAFGGLNLALNIVDSCRAAYLAIRAQVPALAAAGGGAIVNAVGAARPGRPEEARCVVGLTSAAALDHGRDGIRVNAIVPGGGSPSEFASTALWLCSDRAAHVTGAAVPLGLRPVAA